MTTPASLSFGVQQDVTPRWAVMAEAQWTDWSTFDQLTVEFDNPAQPDNVTEEEWKDSWFFALGSTYKATDTVTLRAGVAYDQSPVKDEFRTPRIPDEDRYWLSVGAGWQPASWIDLDGSFTYIQVEDSEVDLAASDTGEHLPRRSRGRVRQHDRHPGPERPAAVLGAAGRRELVQPLADGPNAGRRPRRSPPRRGRLPAAALATRAEERLPRAFGQPRPVAAR